MKDQIAIDVSHHQGEINWRETAGQVRLAILRVGYRSSSSGRLVQDRQLRNNIRGCEEEGLPWGIYIYSQATSPQEAREEADFALDFTKGAKYFIGWAAFDLENFYSGRIKGMSKRERTEAAAAFAQRVRERGCQPLLYGSYGQLPVYFQLDRLKEIPVWTARYSRSDNGTIPNLSHRLPNVNTWLWQYSSKGTTAGIKGYVDQNLLLTDLPIPKEPVPRELLRLGSRGEGVKWLQKKLNEHGAHLAEDGIFGEKTLLAVRGFQKQRGITVDGVAGSITKRELIKES